MRHVVSIHGISEKTASFFVAGAGCLWGTMGIFVRLLNKMGLSSMQIVEIRCFLAAMIGVAAVAVYDRRLLKIRLRDIWCFLGTGILSMVFFNVCYFSAIQQMSLSGAAILLYTSPIFVLLFSRILFKERITAKRICCLVLIVCGCALVSGIWKDLSLLTGHGISLGLGAGLGYALYSIFSRYALERGYHPVTILIYTFGAAAVGGLPFSRPSEIVSALHGGPSQWGLLLLYALVTTVLPYFLYTAGLSRLENGRAAMLAALEPVVATLLGALVFREIPSWGEGAGIVLVLGGICLLNHTETGRKLTASE